MVATEAELCNGGKFIGILQGQIQDCGKEVSGNC